MTNPEVALMMLALFIVLVLLGFPIAFTLLAMGVAFGYYAYHREGSVEVFSDIFNNNIFYLVNQNTYSVMENPILVAIPLFLFMGYVVERANIVDKLFFSLYMAARNLPGSLAIAALLTCAVFSTASGIVGAVVTLMGLLAFPAMANANYDKSFAAGVICAGGTLGILIPPSIMLIVYAAIADLSPLRLYAAAALPRIAAGGPVYRIRHRTRMDCNPALAPKPTTEDPPPPREIYLDLLKSFCSALTVLIALGSGLDPWWSGHAGRSCRHGRPWWHGAGGPVPVDDMDQAEGKRVSDGQSHGNGLLALRRVMDVCVGLFLSRRPRHHRPLALAGWTWSLGSSSSSRSSSSSVLGWPLEWSEILIIFVPIFLPLLEVFGVNPYFFAMLIALNLQTSFLTPPMAMSAYYLKGVLKNQIELMEIFRGIMPYLGIVILTMCLMYVIPRHRTVVP